MTFYSFEIKPELAKKLKKIKKKDTHLFIRIQKKIFEINEDEHIVEFLDFAHHDEIYL